MQSLTEAAVAASEAHTAAAHAAAQAAESSAAESAALAVAHQDVASSQSAVADRLSKAPATTRPDSLTPTRRPLVDWPRVQRAVQEAAAVVAGGLARLWLWIRLWVGDVRLFLAKLVGDAQAWVQRSLPTNK